MVAWALTEKTLKEFEKRVRIEAIRNARSLAEDYAAGDGFDVAVDKLTLVSVADHQSYGNFSSPLRSASASVGAFKQAAVVANFSPEEITVAASISTTFETATA